MTYDAVVVCLVFTLKGDFSSRCLETQKPQVQPNYQAEKWVELNLTELVAFTVIHMHTVWGFFFFLLMSLYCSPHIPQYFSSLCLCKSTPQHALASALGLSMPSCLWLLSCHITHNSLPISSCSPPPPYGRTSGLLVTYVWGEGQVMPTCASWQPLLPKPSNPLIILYVPCKPCAIRPQMWNAKHESWPENKWFYSRGPGRFERSSTEGTQAQLSADGVIPIGPGCLFTQCQPYCSSTTELSPLLNPDIIE